MDYSSSWVDTSLDLSTNSHSRRLQFQPRCSSSISPPRGSLIEFGSKSSLKQETSSLVLEIERLSEENKKLTEMLSSMCKSYNALRSQLMDYMHNNNPAAVVAEKEQEQQLINISSLSKKRNSVESSSNNQNNNNVGTSIIMGNSESSSTDEEPCCKKPRYEEVVKPKISRVAVRTEASDTSLIVKDGYQWRKYGQKVTKDNPCPRAYFKCSFAPSCPVKKKVQRSIEDQCVVVATYEGEHNHPILLSQMEATSNSSNNRTISLGVSAAASSITLDLTKSSADAAASVVVADHHRQKPRVVEKYLVEQMAFSLTRDPNFTAALAAAISGRFFPQ